MSKPRVKTGQSQASGAVVIDRIRSEKSDSTSRSDIGRITEIEQDVEIRYWDDGVTTWDESGIYWDIWYSNDGDVQTNDFPQADINKEQIRNG